VAGREPAVRAAQGHPHAVVRVASDPRPPRDDLYFGPVGQMNGREDLPSLVHERYRPLPVTRTIDEDALPDCDRAQTGRRAGDRAVAGLERQWTSSGEMRPRSEA